MPIEVLSTLTAMAAIIALGFLGYLFFERTRITDVLILIGFGVLIGPVLKVFDVAGFKSASALVGTLALIVIMFDGGLGLKLRDLLSGIARSTALALLGFALTIGAIALAGRYLIGLDWTTSVLLGTVLGGTSGVIIMPIITRTTAHASTQVILSVESALTDVLCVISTVALVTYLTTPLNLAAGAIAGADASQVSVAFRGVASQFAIAIVAGLLAGFLWMRLLKRLERMKYSYMITLAATLFLYVGAEGLGGNGAIAVLIYGIVLGNGFAIARKFEFEGVEFSDQQRQFQGEITFLIRVFFFVYLGVILDPQVLANTQFLRDSAIILGAIVAARAIAVYFVTRKDPETRPDRLLVTLLLPRGLAAAVLAGLPAQAGLAGTESFIAYAFIAIVATNLVGTGAVVGYEFKKKRAQARAAAPVPVATPKRAR